MWSFLSVLAFVVGLIVLARIGARAAMDYVRESRKELLCDLSEASKSRIEGLARQHLEQAHETDGAIREIESKLSEVEGKVAALTSAQALRRR